MAREEPWALRAKLLGVAGIGRETADSIALYAAGLPLFVVDAYTRRVFARLGLVRGDEPYDVLQRVFMDALPAEAPLYNEYHAQIVLLAKDVCRTRPACGICPLADVCQRRGVLEWINHGGVTVSTGTTTPGDAGRACYRLVNPVESHNCQR
jgi:endonuclease-3 related protein